MARSIYRPVTVGSAVSKPILANPMDSRWGGPTPWARSVNMYRDLGIDAPTDRPFESAGKFDITQGLPLTSVMPSTMLRDNPAMQLGPEQPGIFEGLIGGIGHLTDLVPILNTQNGLIKDTMSFVGSTLDNALDFLPSLAFGGNMQGDVENVFNMLPEDELKLQYKAFMAKDSMNKYRYMAQYLNQRGTEIARLREAPGSLQDIVTPSLTASEALRRMVFGALMLPGEMVTRTWAGLGRDVDNDILKRPDEQLPPELVTLKQRHLSGQISRDEFLDELSLGKYRWNNGDDTSAAALSFVLDIITDPVTWASFGVGKAVEVAGVNGVRAAEVAIQRAVKAAGREWEVTKWASQNRNLLREGFAYTDRTNVARWAEANAPDIVEQALNGLSKRQIAEYRVMPVLENAQKVVNSVNSMFDWFGLGKIGHLMHDNMSTHFGTGWLSYHGYRNAKDLRSFFGNSSDFDAALSTALVNENVALHQRNLSKEMLGHGDEWRGDGLIPDEVIRDRMDVADSLFTDGEASAAMNAVTPSSAATIGAGPQDAARAKFIDDLAVDLAEMSGKSHAEAVAFLSSADDRMIALVHRLQYGRQVDRFIQARGFEASDAAHAAMQARKFAADKLAEVIRLKESIAKLKKNPPKTKRSLPIGEKRWKVWEETIATYETKYLPQAEQAAEEASINAQKAQQHQANVDRYTLVGDRALTLDRARTLSAALGGDVLPTEAQKVEDLARIADDAIDQYDILSQNFKQSHLDRVERITWVRDYVNGLLSDGGSSLPVLIERSKLGDVGLSLNNRYEVALMPEGIKRWGIQQDASGKVVGANTFVDVVSGADSPAAIKRAISGRDVFRSEWFQGIRGSRLYFEARSKFVHMGARSYGLHRGDATRLFEAIRAESFKRGVGTRGLKASDINQIARDVSAKVEPAVLARIGERGLLELTVKAWEGELRSVGLAPKVAGKAKSQFVKRTDNLLGRVSEDLYVKARFAMNPLFLFMETTEGPFFAILRGIKPGFKWSADDIRANSVLQHIHGGELLNEQLERAQRWTADAQTSVRIAGPQNGWTARWREFLHMGPGPAVKTSVKGLHEWKELLYVRQWVKQSAGDWYANTRRYAPQVLSKWEEALGTSNKEKLFLAYMEDRGAFNPDARHGLHLLDAAKPPTLGRRERVRLGDVARFHGYETVREMVDFLRNGGDPAKDQFLERYRSLGMNEDYAMRAYKIASGFSEEEWLHAIRSTIKDSAESEAYINFHRWMARRAKTDFAEYMNDRYSDFPRLVNSGKEMNPGTLHQTVEEHIVTHLGEDAYHSSASPVFKRVQARQQQILPAFKAESKDAMEKANDVAGFQKDVREGRNTESWMPATSEHHPHFGEAVGSEAEYQKMVETDYLETILRTYSDGAFAGNIKKILSASNWYNEVPTMFIALAKIMPDHLVDSIEKLWRSGKSDFEGVIAKAMSEHGLTRKEAVQEEIAARLNIAFAATQQNTGVADGMRFVFRMMNVIQNQGEVGALKFGLEGPTERLMALLNNYEEGLTEKGIGPKLADFIDALAAKNTRSITDNLADFSDVLEPGAMDIWMRRMWGFPDGTYISMLTISRLMQEGKMDLAKAKGTFDMVGYDWLPASSFESRLVEDTAMSGLWGKDWLDEATKRSEQALDAEVERIVNAKWVNKPAEKAVKDAEKVLAKAQKAVDDHAAKREAASVKGGNAWDGWQSKEASLASDLESAKSAHSSAKEYQKANPWMNPDTKELVTDINAVKTSLKSDEEIAKKFKVSERIKRSASPEIEKTLKEYGWENERRIPPDSEAPSGRMYEYLLIRTNQMRRYLNEYVNPDGSRGYLREERIAAGMRPEWNATEVQAFLWVGEQARLSYRGTDPIAGFIAGGGAFAAEAVNPNMATVADAAAAKEAAQRGEWRVISEEDGAVFERYPGYEALSSLYGERHANEIIDNITRDVTDAVIPVLSESTGAIVFNRVHKFGVWRGNAISVSSPLPNVTFQLVGSSKAITSFGALYAYAFRQHSVMAFSRPYEIALRVTKAKPDLVSQELSNTPVHWAAHYQLPDRVFEPSFTSSVDAVEMLTRFIDNELLKSHPVKVVDGVEHSEFKGSLVRLDENGQFSITLRWDTAGHPDYLEYDGRVPKSIAEKRALLPESVLERLSTGDWVKDIEGNQAFDLMESLPVRSFVDLLDMRLIEGSKNEVDNAQLTRGFVPEDVGARVRQAAQDASDRAYAKHANAAFSQHIEANKVAGWADEYAHFGDDLITDGPLFQRGRGRIRGGFLPDAGDGRAIHYFTRGHHDLTTIVHESFHSFLESTDESARSALLDEYNSFNGAALTLLPGGRLPRVAEEWLASQFEKFAANPENYSGKNATYYHTFASYAEWAKKAMPPEWMEMAGSGMKDAFDTLLDSARDIVPAHYNPSEQRLWEATRVALMRAEESAFKTVYYKKSRSFFERSLNHPYLGLYPASYMWGKVLPELTRFLVKKPFGWNAPLFGLSASNHVYRNVAMQLETDEELQKWVKDHPETVNFMTLMVPGTPWELPVNLPLVMRRWQEEIATARLEGREPNYDVMKNLGDMMSYAFGPTQMTRRIGSIGSEFNEEPAQAQGTDTGAGQYIQPTWSNGATNWNNGSMGG